MRQLVVLSLVCLAACGDGSGWRDLPDATGEDAGPDTTAAEIGPDAGDPIDGADGDAVADADATAPDADATAPDGDADAADGADTSDAGTEEPDGAGPDAIDDAEPGDAVDAPFEAAPVGTWTKLEPQPGPWGRMWFGFAYDEARARIVLFGGRLESDSPVGDTWEWDGTSWIHRTPTPPTQSSPSGREKFSMVYDSRRKRVVVFGGMRRSWMPETGVNDLWEWDGEAGTWIDRTPSPLPASWPQPRHGHAMADDPTRGRLLLFGGTDTARPTNLLDDTWEWDGESGSWTRRSPPSSPFPRILHGMAYAGDGRVVLFGGHWGFPLGDTWEWDGAVGTWTRRTPPFSPVSRSEFALGQDARRARPVLYGGFLGGSNPDKTVEDDFWEWDTAGGTWRELPRAQPRPSGRRGHGLAYDTRRATILLFSGEPYGTVGGKPSDLWEWTP